MNEEFKKKLIDDIEKSGFPMELEIMEKLYSKGLRAHPNYRYKDNLNNLREIDAFAFFSPPISKKYGDLGLNIVIECKKSPSKPWIFFEQIRDPIDPFGLVGEIRFQTNFPLKENVYFLTLCENTGLKFHHYNAKYPRHVPIARTYYEAFSKQDQVNLIYKSIESVAYAMNYLDRSYKSNNASKTDGIGTYLNNGVIVFDGELVVANKENDTLQLSSTNHILFRTTDFVETSSQNTLFSEEPLVIDIVKKDYFDEFLEILKKDIEYLFFHFADFEKLEYFDPSRNVG